MNFDPNMDRRALMQRMMLLIGASAMPIGIDAFAAPAKRAKKFLDAKRFRTLTALADTILPQTDTPGALAAKVPARLDGLLGTWASGKTQQMMIGAIDRVEAAAKAQKKKSFAALSAADRAALLGPYDAAALKPVPAPANEPAGNPFMQFSYVSDQGYLKIKELVINLYYYSETGSKSELFYDHTPGVFQPSIKLTPQSRPNLGIGPF